MSWMDVSTENPHSFLYVIKRAGYKGQIYGIMHNSTLYIQKLQQLLQIEYKEQKEEYRMQSERMGIQRKIRRGICWFPIEIGNGRLILSTSM